MKQAYGGVIIDDAGRVLLRRPRNQYDDYAWTFAKGGPDGDETPEQAALREVREESGIEAEIVTPIPGRFEGGMTVTGYFLMRVVSDHGDFDRKETEQVVWATPEAARAMIAETQNGPGRARDLAVLEAGLSAWSPRQQA